MDHFDLSIKFNLKNNADASFAASDLEQFYRESGIDCTRYSNEKTQDLGSIVGIILGSASLTVIARGVADRIRRYNVCDIEIVGKTRTIKIKDAPKSSIEELTKSIAEVVE
nr:hypothetical protein [uncultured Cohaesibacter sp.]